MRLSEIKSLLDSLNLTVQLTISTSAPNRIDTIAQIAPVTNVLVELAKIPGFERLVKRMPRLLFGTRNPLLQVPIGEGQAYQTALNEILLVARGLQTVLTDLLSAPDPNAIFIKLPEPRDLGDAIDSLNSIHKALEQVVLDKRVNGCVTLKTWEPGSFWVTLILGGPIAVGIVGAIAWSAAVVYKKVQEGRWLAEKVEALKASNEAINDIRQKQEQQTALLIEGEAMQIMRMQLNVATPEEERETLERIKLSIKLFSDLIDRGAQINPALEAPEEVKNLFPDFAKLGSVESKTKQIAAGEKAA